MSKIVFGMNQGREKRNKVTLGRATVMMLGNELAGSTIGKPSSSRKTLKSKFFFDMLLAMDKDVMAEYVVPHLNCFENLRWTARLMVHGEEGGLFKRSIVSDFLLPCTDQSLNIMIKSSQYMEDLARGDGMQLVRTRTAFASTVDMLRIGAGITLGIDLTQCRECSCPCMWVVNEGGTSCSQSCVTRGRNVFKLNCAEYAECVKLMLLECNEPPTIAVLQLEHLDVATPVGRHIMKTTNDIIQHNQQEHARMGRPISSLPLTLDLSDILLKSGVCEDNLLLTKLVTTCMKQDCHTVRLNSFIVLGNTLTNRETTPTCGFSTSSSPADVLFSALSSPKNGSPIKSLSITDMGIMSYHTLDIMGLCKTILM